MHSSAVVSLLTIIYLISTILNTAYIINRDRKVSVLYFKVVVLVPIVNTIYCIAEVLPNIFKDTYPK